jgi:hypothetical protein
VEVKGGEKCSAFGCWLLSRAWGVCVSSFFLVVITRSIDPKAWKAEETADDHTGEYDHAWSARPRAESILG